MKMQFTKYILFTITLFLSINSFAQTDMLFWFVAPEVNDEHHNSSIEPNGTVYGQPTYFRFTNSEAFDVTVTISQPSLLGPMHLNPISVVLPANSTRSIEFHRTAFDNITSFDLDNIENYINKFTSTTPRPGNVGYKGLKIEATGRITAYYEVNASVNKEILSLKGRNALGTEFFVPFQTMYGTEMARYTMIYSAIDIVATEPNTQVTITPTENMLLVLNTQQSWVANTPYTITLQAGETFTASPYGVGNNTPWNIDRTKQLAGTKVTSNKPIAVNTKDDLVDAFGVDLVADQLVPVKMLGNDYIVMKNVSLTFKNEYAYVVATDNNTRIYVDGVYQWTLAQGKQREVLINGNKLITSPDSAFYVFHVSGVNYSGGAQMGGAVLPTVSTCTGSYSVSFVRSSSDNFYMNVMVRDGGQNGFEINGVPRFTLPSDWTGPITTPSGDWYIASKSFNTGDISVNTVQTIVNTSNKLFHLGILNGVNDCFYGYFSDFNSIDVIGNVGTTINTDYFACYGESVELVAYGANNYLWHANISPSFLNGQESLQRPLINPTANRKYTVVGYGDCNMKDSVDINVYVADQIVSDFVLDNPGWPPCSPWDIIVANEASGADYRYKWWFGDGTGDTLLVATDVIPDTLYHTYTNLSDTIQVRELALITENKFYCKDTLKTEVIVYPEIHAQFVPDKIIGCNPLLVNFDDQSYGNLGSYRWVYADGAIGNTAGDVSHTYTHTNENNTVDYNVELRLTSPFFCRDTARTTISVYPYLEAGFTINEDDGCSPLPVTITNVSAGEDNITLDYGDGSAPLGVASFISVNHTYTNVSSTVDTNIIVLTVTNVEGCSEVWRDTVIVYPEVNANFAIDGGVFTGCNTRNATFTNSSNYGIHTASIFTWTFGDGATSGTTNVNVPHTYNNTTSADYTYPFKLRAESKYGCWDEITQDITLYRVDADFNVNTNEGCSDLPVTITNTSIGDDVPAVGGWAWAYGDGATNANKEPAIPHIHNYTNTTTPGVVLNRTLSLTLTHAGCTDTKTETIKVNPSIVVSITTNPAGPVAICDSLPVSFTPVLNRIVAGTTYLWDFNDGISSASSTPTHIYRNLTNSNDFTYTAKVTATTPNGCISNSSVPILVHPFVKAKYTIDKVSGCSPLTVDPVASYYIGINQYRWNFGDGSPIYLGQDPPAHTYPVNTTGGNTTYPLQLQVLDPSGNCTSSTSKTITVYSENKANFTPQITTGCNPQTVNFINTSFNSTSFLWDFNDGTTSNLTTPLPKTFTNTTDALKSYTVKLSATSDMGCTHDTTVVAAVNVYRNVKADFAVDIIEGCSPVTVTITNNSKGGNYRWYWNSQTGTGAADYTSVNGTEEFTHQYTNTSGSDITYYLTLVAENANGCSKMLTKQILVHSSIIANFSFVQNNACNPSDVVFTNTSTGGGSYTMNWVFGDGSTLTTTTSPVPKTFTNNTTNDKTFTVIMSAESENGCTDTHQENITVYSKLVADFSIPVSASCPPFKDAVIENKSVGNSLNNYQWFVDNNAVADFTSTGLADFIRTYNNTNQSVRPYSIRLLATNAHACTSEKTGTISVYEYIKAQFTMDRENGCTPLNIDFDNKSLTTAQTKYLWTFGDGATSGAFEPLNGHKFYNTSRVTDKPYTIGLKLTSENFCAHDTSDQILVYHQPLSKFFIDKTSSCPPLITNLTKESEGEDIYEWRFGDGNTNTTSSTVTYTYPNTLVDVVQNYNLELWVSTVFGCKDSTALTLNVFPYVVADFTYGEQGCSPFVSTFTNTSTSPAQYFYWNFDDGSTSNQENPVHEFTNTFNQDLIYNVYLKASSEYNCWDTITKPVRVFLQPIAEFNIDPIVQKFPKNRVFIDNRSNTGPFDYFWEIGNIDASTSTVQSPQYFDYEHWGEKDIKLTVTSQTSSCYDNIMKTATILPPDVNADFSTNINGGCLDNGLEVSFSAESSIYSSLGEEYSYHWDFGDGEEGFGQNINHTYESAGSFYVKMTATSNEGGQDFAYTIISVYSNPVANFEVSPKIAMVDATSLEARVKFYNLSECSDTLGCAYLWEFGDGGSAISRDVTHGYKELGEYDIKLTVTNSYGCIDTLLLPAEVEIIGSGEIQFPNAFTPNGDGINDTFRPVSQGVIEYELLIYNRWGELLFKTNNLSDGWNGIIKGELGRSDVYVWKALGKFTTGQPFELAGDVTLIR